MQRKGCKKIIIIISRRSNLNYKGKDSIPKDGSRGFPPLCNNLYYAPIDPKQPQIRVPNQVSKLKIEKYEICLLENVRIH